MKLTTHFDKEEFNCNCGRNQISTEFVNRLEKLFGIIGADKIIISSGYRCPDCSVRVGGYRDDMHVKGGAADLIVYKNGKPMSSFAVCAIAETTGLFNGISVIDSSYCHLDIRGVIPYKNNRWYGNESTGETYSTFKSYLPSWFNKAETTAKTNQKLKIYLDDVLLIEREI